MAEEYILARDIIHDHSERMLNIKKYYPYFKLTDGAFTQFQGGKYQQLDMGYILMAVLRFFIEENNFRERDVTYDEIRDFIVSLIRRDFLLPLDEMEEEEVVAYIFDKISNGGRPFMYEYFDPVDRGAKTIRMRLIDSRIREQGVVYYITADAIEFYLDTKEIKDESSISVAQVLLSKMISSRNYKGGIEVIRRINSEVGRLKARKNEVLAILSVDVFEGAKAYEDFQNTGIRWFEDEQRQFARNMELISQALTNVDTDKEYYLAVDDIYALETELKKSIIRHSELLSACMDLQVRADEIISAAKFNRLKKSFDFKDAMKIIMSKDRADLIELLVVPMLRLNTKKSFDVKNIDKLLTLRGEKEEKPEIIKESAEQTYIYEDEVEEGRIRLNHCGIVMALLRLLWKEKNFNLARFNEYLVEVFGESILHNGDYYSLLVHMSQKKHYDVEKILEKPETFFEDYVKEAVKNMAKHDECKMDLESYGQLIFDLEFDDTSKLMPDGRSEVSDIIFSCYENAKE